MKRIYSEDAVRVLREIGRSEPAAYIAQRLETSARAVATALRTAVADGRVSIYYPPRSQVALYRFRRCKPVPHAAGALGPNTSKNSPKPLQRKAPAPGLNTALEVFDMAVRAAGLTLCTTAARGRQQIVEAIQANQEYDRASAELHTAQRDAERHRRALSHAHPSIPAYQQATLRRNAANAALGRL